MNLPEQLLDDMADSTPLDAGHPPDLRPGAPASAGGPDGAALWAPPEARKADLERLFGSHARKVKAYYRRSGVSDAAAEDLTQEVFVRALRALGNFRGGSKMSTWLWTIAQNLLLEHRRKPSIEIDEVEGVPVDVDTLTLSPEPRLMDQSDCVRRGFAAFSKDQPERAQAIFLAVVEEFTREELAAQLGRSTHAATEYLSQCKAKFRAYIRHCHDDE